MPVFSSQPEPPPRRDDEGRDEGVDVRVGRQPVFDRRRRIIGYELLFRGTADAVDASRDDGYATAQVFIAAWSGFGLRRLVGDGLCFVNVTREFLTGGLPVPVEPADVVLEIVESVAVDDESIAGVLRLVDAGFRIALDGFVAGSGHEVLLSVADFVKLDLTASPRETLAAVIAHCRRYPAVKLIAKRVEDRRQVRLAARYGFDLLQGYGLGRPETLTARVPDLSRSQRLALFAASLRGGDECAQLEALVEDAPAMGDWLLRVAGPVARRQGRTVRSVADVVAVLGPERLGQWSGLLLVSELATADDARMGAVAARAQLCQAVAARLGLPDRDGYAVGLISGVADLFGEPVAAMVDRLPAAAAIREALLDGGGQLGQVLTLVRAYERRESEPSVWATYTAAPDAMVGAAA